MYEAFYGLDADPFRLSSEPRYCFKHQSYEKARAYLLFALHRAEGFVMVTGQPGTGKTTLVNDLVASLDATRIRAAVLTGAQLQAEDLLRMVAFAFGVDARSAQKSIVLQQLTELFGRLNRQGRRALLIVDEAQDLAPSALEELRLLTNLHHDSQPLLQIFLTGQESLRDLVRQPGLEQLHQRFVAAWHLTALSRSDTIGYVRHRLEISGWRGNPAFKTGVFPVIYRFSQGIPRRINLICSRLLLHGFIHDAHAIQAPDAEAVFAELQQEDLAPDTANQHKASPDTRQIADAPEQPRLNPDSDWSLIDQGLIVEYPAVQPAVLPDVTPIFPTQLATPAPQSRSAERVQQRPAELATTDRVVSSATPLEEQAAARDPLPERGTPAVQPAQSPMPRRAGRPWRLIGLLGFATVGVLVLSFLLRPDAYQPFLAYLPVSARDWLNAQALAVRATLRDWLSEPESEDARRLPPPDPADNSTQAAPDPGLLETRDTEPGNASRN